MARVLVVSDDRQHIVMDELVIPVHFETAHSSLQVIERMADAVVMADDEYPSRQHARPRS